MSECAGEWWRHNRLRLVTCYYIGGWTGVVTSSPWAPIPIRRWPFVGSTQCVGSPASSIEEVHSRSMEGKTGGHVRQYRSEHIKTRHRDSSKHAGGRRQCVSPAPTRCLDPHDVCTWCRGLHGRALRVPGYVQTQRPEVSYALP